MFTGIIQKIGLIKSIKSGKFCFGADNNFFDGVKVGDSIATNGVCLTTIEIGSDYFKADLSIETLDCSTFKNVKVGDYVNLEKALRLNQGIDGHLVSGHVDAIAKVVDKYPDGDSKRFKISVPQNLIKYIARKGSVTINGVSLTVNEIDNNIFGINIVPHTLIATTFGQLNKNDEVNLEVDIIARHLEQLLNNRAIEN